MSITVSTKTYALDAYTTPDRVKYVGPANTASVKDQIFMSRVAPKKTKDFDGVVRAAEKTVKSVVINGITRDCIAETFFSYPVGTPGADVTALRVDHSSLISAAPTQLLVDKAQINH